MRDLSFLWSDRFKRFLKELGRYARLILNDHFSIILVLMLGFFLIFYREQLLAFQAINPQGVLPVFAVLVAVSLMVLGGLGYPLWLMKAADRAFVFARGPQWRPYWLRGLLWGLLLPLFINFNLIGLLWPFLKSLTGWANSHFGLLFFSQVIYVILMQMTWLLSLYRPITAYKTVLGLVYAIFLFIAVLNKQGGLLLMMALCLALVLGVVLALWMKDKEAWLDFDRAIEIDNNRQAIYYGLLSFFVDVPQVSSQVLRRSYLDRLLNRVKLDSTPQAYLLVRMLARHKAYSGIWIRLMCFTAILLSLDQSVYLRLGLGLAGLYLTFVQLVPLVNEYGDHPMMQLYPNFKDTSIKALRGTLLVVLGLQSLSFSIVVLIKQGLNATSILVIGAWGLGLWLLLYPYLSFTLSKRRSS